MYYGGGVGFKIAPKQRFGYVDTIVSVDEITAQAPTVVASQDPKVQQQLVEMGIIKSAQKIATDQKPLLDTQTTQEKSPPKPQKDIIAEKKASRVTEPQNDAIATKQTSRSAVNAELARLRADAVAKMKETRAGTEKLLAVHEAEVKKLTVDFKEREERYNQGRIARAELDEIERALARAILRVEEDKRWITEADMAITEATLGLGDEIPQSTK